MNIKDLKAIRRSCCQQVEQRGCKDASVSMVFPDSKRAPKGFPLRELLCVNGDGGYVFRMNAYRMLAWLDDAQAALEKGEKPMEGDK